MNELPKTTLEREQALTQTVVDTLFASDYALPVLADGLFAASVADHACAVLRDMGFWHLGSEEYLDGGEASLLGRTVREDDDVRLETVRVLKHPDGFRPLESQPGARDGHLLIMPQVTGRRSCADHGNVRLTD